ncbi:MAG: transglutaminase family protein [Pseudomonadota bacterium]
MLYQVRHVTQFSYAHPVSTSRQLLRMTPRHYERQHVTRAVLQVSPKPFTTSTRLDYFGNTVTDIDVHEEHRELTITAQSQVEILSQQAVLLELSPAWEQVVAGMRVPETFDMWQAARFCYASPRIKLDQVRSYARLSFHTGRALLPAVQDLTSRIFRDFEYVGGVTDIYTPVSTILRTRRGVCQDFAHFAIACLRALGLPARYVSGYLLTQPPPGSERLVGADASHAWFAVWCPEFGWVDFDPTNDLRPGKEHITVGWGRDYGDVAPSIGVIRGGGLQTLDVSVDVRPLGSSNRQRRRQDHIAAAATHSATAEDAAAEHAAPPPAESESGNGNV